MAASKPALSLRDVHKRYGARRALDGLTFEVPRGSITGFVGPNGAGKTTCFGVAAGLLRADAGDVDVLGRGPYDPSQVRGQLGILPQDSELPAHGRVATQLTYLAHLQGLTRREAQREADRVLELVALRDRAQARIGELSHGMRRRVSVAQALLGQPALVLLDEPTAGLDPHLVKHVRDVIVEENRARGASFVVSSHVLAELEVMCDRVVFIEAGRILASGALDEITGRGENVRIRVARTPALAALRSALPGVTVRLEDDELIVEVSPEQRVDSLNDRVLSVLVSLDAGVLEVRRGASLERTYLAQRERLEAQRTQSTSMRDGV